MATTDKQPRKLNDDEIKLVKQALTFYWKSCTRAANTATDEVLKNHHQTKAYAVSALNNKLAQGELDLT